MTVTIGRRELLVALGGAAAGWPLAARAQQPGKMVSVGILALADLPPIDTFRQTLNDLGYVEGKNVRFEHRYAKSAQSRRFRDLIFTLAARHRLPSVSSDRSGVVSGCLVSYGAKRIDQYRHAAVYIDRILKGEKPANLPVQAPTKYQLVINLKTAKALGIDVPASVLARADEVIE